MLQAWDVHAVWKCLFLSLKLQGFAEAGERFLFFPLRSKDMPIGAEQFDAPSRDNRIQVGIRLEGFERFIRLRLIGQDARDGHGGGESCQPMPLPVMANAWR